MLLHEERDNSPPQVEDHIHRGFHGNRLTVQQEGAVTPGADGIESGLLKHGWTADDAQVFDSSLFRDCCFERNGSLHTRYFGDGRIYGKDLVDHD